MSETLGSALLDLRTDDRDLKRGIDRAERSAQRLDRRFRQTARNIGDSFQRMGRRIGQTGRAVAGFGRNLSLGVTAPILAAGAAGIKAASDLQESMNAVQVVFGDSADVITDWGRTAAENAGISRAAFNEAATTIGSQLQNMGFSARDAAQESINLGQRAADMASVFNTDVGQALDAIMAGLRGEIDPLERFGVGLSVAAVESHALAEGMIEAGEEMSDTEKTTARLSLLMKQTERVAGDFKATSDDLANSWRVLRARLVNMAAEIGERFLPIAARLVNIGRELLTRFEGLSAETKTMVLAIAGIAAAAGPVIVVLGGITIAVGALATAIGGLITIATGPFGLIAIIAGAFIAWQQDIGGMRDLVDAFKDAAIAALQALGQSWDALLIDLGKRVANKALELQGVWFDTVSSIASFVERHTGFGESIADAAEAGAEGVRSLKLETQAWGDIIKDNTDPAIVRRFQEEMQRAASTPIGGVAVKGFEMIRDGIQRARDALSTHGGLSGALDAALSKVSSFFAPIEDGAKGAGDAARNAGDTAAEAGDKAAEAGSKAADTWEQLQRTMRSMAGEVAPNLKEQLRLLGDTEVDVSPTINVQSQAEAARGGRQQFMQGLGRGAVSRIPGVGGAISGGMQAGPMGALAGGAMGILQSNEKFQALMQRLTDAIVPLVDPIVEALAPAMDAIAPVLKQLQPVFEVAGMALARLLKPMVFWMEQLARLMAPVEKALSSVETAVDRLSTPLEGLQNAIDGLRNALGNLGGGLFGGGGGGGGLVGDVLGSTGVGSILGGGGGFSLGGGGGGGLFHGGGRIRREDLLRTIGMPPDTGFIRARAGENVQTEGQQREARTVPITLKGDVFSRQGVRRLLEQIQDEIGDDAGLRLAVRA